MEYTQQCREMMELLKFPEDAMEFLDRALEKILEDPRCSEDFSVLLWEYGQTVNLDYAGRTARMGEISRRAGIHEYTGNMLMFLGMCRDLRRRFLEEGLSDRLFAATMMDLRYKLDECMLVQGVWGTFVPRWYRGFFRLERVCLGRLQFEVVPLEFSGKCGDVVLTPETPVINVHIPRDGTRMDHEKVLEAYRMAKDFFRDRFRDTPMVFGCESWLLDPWHLEHLPETSNIRKFAEDYTLIHTEAYPDYSEIWRLFDCRWTGNPDDLPGDSSLRRGYIARIRAGEPTAWSQGVFLADSL